MAATASATVIHTQEWNGPTKPGFPWSFNAPPSIHCGTASPSGGCYLRMTYAGGVYTSSTGGGDASYELPTQYSDLYLGAWMRYSPAASAAGPGFQFHSVGQKVNFFVLGGSYNGNIGNCRNIAFGFSYGTYSATPQICWGRQTHNNYANKSAWDETAHLNEWHWYVMRVKQNTPGASNGIFQMWIDNVLHLEYLDGQFLAVGEPHSMGSVKHTAVYGGGGSTIDACPNTDPLPSPTHVRCNQYWDIDHTVIATTLAEVAMPGGGAPTDVTPPPVPSQPSIPSTGRPATVNWSAVSAGDLAGYRYYRKNEACALNTLSYAVIQDVGNVLTFQDNTIPASVTSICVRISSYDTSTNESLLSTGTDESFSSGSAAFTSNVVSDTTGADITFVGNAHKIRYWDDLIESSSKLEVTGLGGVPTYRLSKIWEPSITFMCVEAQGSDGVWETTVNADFYRCAGVAPGSGDITAPIVPSGLSVR